MEIDNEAWLFILGIQVRFHRTSNIKTRKISGTTLVSNMGSNWNAPSTPGGYSITPRRNMAVDWRTRPPTPQPSMSDLRAQQLDRITPTQKTASSPAEEQILSEQRYWLNNRKVLRRDDFYPGMIIRAPLYEEDYADGKDTGLPTLVLGSNVPAAMSYVSLSNYGYVHSKLRYMIVLATFRYHYMAIPLYTYEGKGLKDKTKDFQDECVSVQDGRLPQAAFKKLSKHPPLVTKMRNDRHSNIKKTSTAHFTRPICRGFDLRVIDVESSLTTESLKSLVNLYSGKMLGSAAS